MGPRRPGGDHQRSHMGPDRLQLRRFRERALPDRRLRERARLQALGGSADNVGGVLPEPAQQSGLLRPVGDRRVQCSDELQSNIRRLRLPPVPRRQVLRCLPLPG
ncbi:unnamed protein product [Cuscuta europaea]|uniref:Uncharacterized protein n=1 Tax=Cuscuta europaea TaxID=41803 RepID=A0A9P0Z721_CUSEU|nr:unnamed protein product [Cuscuta europaea]